MNDETPARIIFKFLCNGKLSIKLEWPYLYKIDKYICMYVFTSPPAALRLVVS